MAAAQLNRLLADYLSDESRVHSNIPFVTETIINNGLLSDQQAGDHDDLAVVKRKWTVRLNALLQSRQPMARWAAISLVKVTCEQSPLLYSANAQTWCAQCLGLLARPEQPVVHEIAMETLSKIFAKSVGKPELLTEVTNKNLSRFHQLLITFASRPDAHFQSTALTALITDLELFPSTTRHVMDKITKICIVPSFEGNTGLEPGLVGRYLVATSRAGGKASIATSWQETLLKMTDTVHEALDRLFDTVDEEDAASFNRTPSYQLSSMPIDYAAAFPMLLQRVQYLMAVMSAYLTTKTDVAVSVPFARIIQLVCRIYNVFPGCVMREFKPKDEYTCLMGLLPALYLSTNEMLASLLYCADLGLTQYGKLLSTILLRLLSESKRRRALRVSVYGLISLCLEQFGHAFAANLCNVLVKSVCDDLKLPERQSLNIVPQMANVKAGKKRSASEQRSGAVFDGGEEKAVPCDIQIAAIETAEQLMMCYGSVMGVPMRTALDTAIVSRLLQPTDPNAVVIKGKLYDCLLASVMNPSTSQASILPYAVRIFTAGVNAETHELRAICRRGLTICDLCMHTRLPPIQRATSVPSAPALQVAEKVDQENEVVQEESNIGSAPDAPPSPQVPAPHAASSPTPTPATVRNEPVEPPTLPQQPSPPQTTSAAMPSAFAITVTEPSVAERSTLVSAFQNDQPVVRAMSDVVEEKVSAHESDHDIEMLSRQSTEATLSMAIDRQDTTVTATTTTTATTTATAIEDGDEESFEIPDIDMAGPDDDDE